MTGSSANSLRILVTECQHLAGLGAVRSFGRAGHEVTAAFLGSANCLPVTASRYVRDTLAHPDSWSRQREFRDWLLDTMTSETYDVLLPISEAAIVACNAVQSRLPRSLTVLAPSAHGLEFTLSKYAATALARDVGVKTPQTVFLGHPAEWPVSWRKTASDLGAFGLPIVIKSDNCLLPDGSYEKGNTVICESVEAAIQLLESRRDSPARFIAQEYIGGHGEGVFLLRWNGKSLLRFAHERIHEIPWTGGWSSLRKSSSDAALIGEAQGLLEAIGYNGVAMLEFRRDPAGRTAFLEINGRLWGSLSLALHSGIDFPLAWLELQMTGQTGVSQKPYRAGMKCCHFFPGEILYLKSVNAAARNGDPGCPSRARVWFQMAVLALNPFMKHDQYWWSDPGPGLVAARQGVAAEARRMSVPKLKQLRHGASRLRVYLASGMFRARKLLQAARAFKWRLQSRRQHIRLNRSNALADAKQILFVCYGNICRSPFAARYYGQKLKMLGLEKPVACSAGCHPQAQRTAPEDFAGYARRAGVDLETHRSRPLTPRMIEEADLVFLMDGNNRRYLARNFPRALDKAYFFGLMSGDGYPFVPDPYGQAEERVMETLSLLKKSVHSTLARVLAGHGKRAWPLRVFMFHAVPSSQLDVPHFCFLTPQVFRQQLELIAQNFDVLPLSEAVEKLRTGELGGPTAAITFDDGFHNNYSVAFPELKRLGLPATIFVSTGFVDTHQIPWFCRVHRALSDTRLVCLEWAGRQYSLSDRAEKSRVADHLMTLLKKMPQPDLEGTVDALEQLLDLEPRLPVNADSPYRMLSSEAIREMARSGLVDFGAHTHTHAILSRLPAEEQCREIVTSIKYMQDLLGNPCTLFAYPNGAEGDYGETAIDCLLEQSVSIALTAVAGSNPWYENPLELHREALGPRDTEAQLQQRIRRMIQEDSAASLQP